MDNKMNFEALYLPNTTYNIKIERNDDEVLQFLGKHGIDIDISVFSIDIKPFQCSFCEVRFGLCENLENVLMQHFKNHHLDRIIKVEPQIEISNSIENELIQEEPDQADAEEQSEYVCSDTNKNKRYQCDQCGSEFTYKRLLLEHSFLHEPSDFHCESCNISYRRYEALSKHMQISHNVILGGKVKYLKQKKEQSENNISIISNGSNNIKKIKIEIDEQVVDEQSDEIITDDPIASTTASFEDANNLTTIDDKKDKRPYKPYPEETLIYALGQIKHANMSVYRASKIYGIPATTLRKRMLTGSVNTKIGRPTIFSADVEQIIEDWIVEMESAGMPVKKSLLVKSVIILAHDMGVNDKLTNGLKWTRNFMERHPRLKMYKSSNQSKHWTAQTKDEIIEWYKKIKIYFEVHNLRDALSDPDRIWNCDESFFKVNPTTSQQDYNSKQKRDEKECCSVMLTVSASGKFAPTLVTYPYEKKIPYEVAQSFPNDWVLRRASSGYETAKNFKDFISDTFYPYLVTLNVKFPIILFLDGHKSHLTLELGTICKEYNIVLVIFPPNSPFIQPLEVPGFQHLKVAYENEVTRWRILNKKTELPKRKFAELLQTALSGINVERIVYEFGACGIYPFTEHAPNFSKIVLSVIPETIEAPNHSIENQIESSYSPHLNIPFEEERTEGHIEEFSTL